MVLLGLVLVLGVSITLSGLFSGFGSGEDGNFNTVDEAEDASHPITLATQRVLPLDEFLELRAQNAADEPLDDAAWAMDAVAELHDDLDDSLTQDMPVFEHQPHATSDSDGYRSITLLNPEDLLNVAEEPVTVEVAPVLSDGVPQISVTDFVQGEDTIVLEADPDSDISLRELPEGQGMQISLNGKIELNVLGTTSLETSAIELIPSA